MIRIAHLSDIHFFHFEKSPLQFFSKRFVGNFNTYLSRKKIFNQDFAYQVVDLLLKENVTHLLITGDYTCTSSKKEFALMVNYIKYLKSKGFTLFTIPGNHDVYTSRADRNKTFYTLLEEWIDFKGDTEKNLIEHRVAAYHLMGNFWLVCCDSARSTALIKSTGVFDKQTEINLKALLKELPKDAKILLANHFPYEKFRYPTAHLERGEALEEIILTHSNIKALLHGHRHRHRIKETRNGHLLLDSGSLSHKYRSSFNLLELSENSIEVHKYKRTDNNWERCLHEQIKCLV